MMNNKRLRVLLIIEQCNPEWASVPLEGYRYFHEIDKLVDVTLVTHDRNREAFERLNAYCNIVYMPESSWSRKYHRLIEKIVYKHNTIWPLYHALSYPIYAEFNHNVYRNFKHKILGGEYDLVHALTPMMPRYPVKAIKACKNVPFLIGPVNGGVPFPPGFQEKAKKEYANLNFLRTIGRWLIPGYVQTYKKADRVLAGSTYTLNLLKRMFKLPDESINLFYENGVLESYFNQPESIEKADQVTLLFVGRLVPYKCADILLEAINRLDQALKAKLKLVVVGDGSERSSLEQKVQQLGLSPWVTFTGWVQQDEIHKYYSQADIFCFPSIREFGGAVVLEAMACGLPCIVANNGGIGEYVTEETGFKIEPLSKEYLTQELTNKIQVLVENENLRKAMSTKAIDRAKEFTWQRKAQKIVEIYHEILYRKNAYQLQQIQGDQPAKSEEVIRPTKTYSKFARFPFNH